MDSNMIGQTIMYMSLGWMLGTVAYFIGFKIGEYRERNRNTNN